MPLHINTFSGGLDRDTNFNAYSNKHYYYAENLRIISDETSNNVTLTSMKDATLKISIPADHTILGTGIMNESLILFIKGSTARSAIIYQIPFVDLSSPITLTTNDSYVKVKNGNLEFGDRVEVICRYENSENQRIWWIDGENYIRTCNLVETDLSSKDSDYFDLYSEIEFVPITFSKLTSGSLKNGVYQYAYCLYGNGKAETAFSPLSQLIPLSSSSLGLTNSKDFRGGDIDVNSGKGIELKINDLSSNDYTRIRIVRLGYSQQNTIPEVNVIYEGTIASDLIITDSGSSIGSMTVEDVNLIPNLFVPQHIGAKSNYMFAANVEEEYFDIDFDARAYRFKNDGGDIDAAVFDSNDDEVGIWIDASDPDYSLVSETHNALNKYNILSNDSAGQNLFKFQTDGTTLGGEGENVSFKFFTSQFVYNSNKNANIVNVTKSTSGEFGNYVSATLYSKIGYQRDEIYRFAIIFIDDRGRKSFAKWIADIRFPSIEDYALFSEGARGGDNRIYGNILGIEFTIDTSSLPSNVVSFQIVRTERLLSDGTVIDTGYVGKPEDDTTNIKFDYLLSSGSSGSASSILEYVSGDVSYNGNLYSGDRLDLYQSGIDSNVVYSGGSGTLYTEVYNTILTTLLERVNITDTYLFEAVNSSDGTSSVPASFGTTSSIKHLVELTSPYRAGSKGTTLLIKTASDVLGANSIAYVLRRRSSYPYGGYTYSARQASTYIACSNVTPIATTTIQVYGGDTFISCFEYMRVLRYSKEATDGYMSILFAGVESKINFNYTINPRWTTYTDGKYTSDVVFAGNYRYNAMWETKGVWDLNTDETFTQDFDLYTYNPVYSTEQISQKFFPKPLDINDNLDYITRIYRSDLKYNGELDDSWSKFRFNNFLDLDANYGAINKLEVFNDKLLAFQSRGIAYLPVAEKEVINTQSGSPTVIGTGGVLDRFDYVSTTSGTTQTDSIVKSNRAIYYADDYNRKLARLTDKVEYLSDLKGIKSWAATKTFTNCYSLFNHENNEVWFKIDTGTDSIVKFNEYIDAFDSFVSSNFIDTFKYHQQIKNNTYIFSITNGYSLNTNSNYLEYNFEAIINPNGNIVNRLDSIGLSSIVMSGGNESSDLYMNYQIVNNYQDTTLLDIDNYVRRRFRTWYINYLRDSSTGSRLYDTYFKLKLDGGSLGENVKIFDIISSYTPINLRTM